MTWSVRTSDTDYTEVLGYIGVNLAIKQSETEVLKKRDIGSSKRDNFFSLAMLAIVCYSYGICHIHTSREKL